MMELGFSEKDKEQQLTYHVENPLFQFHCTSISESINIVHLLGTIATKSSTMAGASAIFPLLPSKNLFYVLIKIFQDVNEDQDIHSYRLVCKGWRDFIDQEILSSPAFRKRFLQHPLAMPVEKRRPLISTQVLIDKKTAEDVFNCSHKWFVRGPYVLMIAHGDLYIFRKTNVNLILVGKIALPYPPEYGPHSFAISEDYLFQLSFEEEKCLFPLPPIQLRTFSTVKQGETWIPCKHPARHLWEQEGTELLGMRQVSESKILLLVFQQKIGLLQVINLSDGTTEFATKNFVLPEEKRIEDRESLRYGRASKIFDMDDSGLIIHVCYFRSWVKPIPYSNLQHFSFASQEKTWHTEFQCCNCRIRKMGKVTCLKSDWELKIIDNTSGVVTNRVTLNFAHAFWENIICYDDYIVSASPQNQHSSGITILNIVKNEAMYFPFKVPGLPWDDQCFLACKATTKQSETVMLCSISVGRHHAGGDTSIIGHYVVWFDVRPPGRMTALAKLDKEISAFVPCDHGFFALAYQRHRKPFDPPLFIFGRQYYFRICSFLSFKY